MRHALFGVLILCAACQSEKREITTIVTPVPTIPDELLQKKSTKIVRATNRNLNTWHDLRYIQGNAVAAVAMRRAIEESVDEDFEVYVEVAQHGELLQLRNMAIKALGFARKRQNKKKAHKILVTTLNDDSPTLVANAALGLGFLYNEPTVEVDIALLIDMLEEEHRSVRANAASALSELFKLRETPRPLDAEYGNALARLTGLLTDSKNPRGRRAAVAALSAMHSPDTLDSFITAIGDDDLQVQIGALDGIRRLKDPRALDALIEYLGDSPPAVERSYAIRALKDIMISSGLCRDAHDFIELEESSRKWRKYLAKQRMERG